MRSFAKWLVRAGLAVWLFGIAAAISGVWVTLPPVATEWLVLSLAVTSGGLLVVSGIALGRGVPRGELGAGSDYRALTASSSVIGAEGASEKQKAPSSVS